LEEAEAHALFACEVVEAEGVREENVIVADALHMLGRVEYALGHFESGDRHFSAGLDMLERLGRQEEMAEQSAYYAQLLEKNGREREAFDYFRRAFQVSQQLTR
jgi:tetratricopeptide (TPR) repeat protein